MSIKGLCWLWLFCGCVGVLGRKEPGITLLWREWNWIRNLSLDRWLFVLLSWLVPIHFRQSHTANTRRSYRTKNQLLYPVTEHCHRQSWLESSIALPLTAMWMKHNHYNNHLLIMPINRFKSINQWRIVKLFRITFPWNWAWKSQWHKCVYIDIVP